MKEKFIVILVNLTIAITGLLVIAGCHKEKFDLTDIEGNGYHIVTIGTQVWTVENLRTTHYNNREAIPIVKDSAQWINLSTGACCFYSNNSGYKNYGCLYNWYAINDSRQLAPIGWHIATDADWQTLIDYLGGQNVAGGKLKVTGTGLWLAPNAGATNETGFSAIPAGCRNNSGSFLYLKNYSFWWSSTPNTSNEAFNRLISSDAAQIVRGNYDKKNGFTVKCVKD